MSFVVNLPDLKVKQIKTPCLAHYAYIIHADKDVAFVDPLRDIKAYLDYLQEHHHAKTKYIFETHYHADFVSGFYDLHQHTHGQIVFGPDSKPTFQCKVAHHNEKLHLGNYFIRVLHTPGHTLESSCFVLEDASEKAICVFTGDTLFLGEVGRPDLAQASSITDKDLARMLFHSLKHLKKLPEACIVLPAHGAGSACGKNISPGDSCTIGKQLTSNKSFMEEDEKTFVEMATGHIPPPPAYFGLDVHLNKTGKVSPRFNIR